MPPTKSWGKNALLVPYPQSSTITNPDRDIYRILASYDGTEIFIENQFIKKLNKGEFYEDKLIQPTVVTSSAPILVAQFKKTSQTQFDSTISDPFMMIISPVEQFGNFYRFINIQAYEYDTDYNNWMKVYTEQFLTVVAPTSTISTIRLNASPIPPANFKPIPNTNYSYAWIAMEDGPSTISADDNFGIYVYGYGVANSYGYFGGMNFKRLDFKPPEITSNIICYYLEGIIYDTSANDSKIREVYSPAESIENVAVNIEIFTPYKDIVKFNAWLNDIYNDGRFTIIATDSAGLYSKSDFDIPGFTLRPTRIEQSNLTLIDTTVRTKLIHCFDIEIENYGNFNQILTEANFKSETSSYFCQNQFPINIKPGEKANLRICFSSNATGKFLDTLEIINYCGERDIAILIFNVLDDDQPPKVSVSEDPCNREFILTITDSLSYDYGIENIDIIETINCTITLEQFSSRLSRCKVFVNAPSFDAYYKISISDSAGHITTIEKDIPGFTIDILGINESVRKKDFAKQRIGSIWCDSILIYNYGNFPFTLNKTQLYRNILFSTPLSQYPIIIEPGDTLSLLICYHPVSSDTIPDLDSLYFEFNCNFKTLILSGEGEELNYQGKSRCGLSLKLDISNVSNSLHIEPFAPNPTTTIISSLMTLRGNESIQVRVINTVGKVEFSDYFTPKTDGLYEYSIDVSSIPQGIYFIIINSNSKLFSEKIIISR